MRWCLIPFLVACGSTPSNGGDAGSDATVKDASSELLFSVDAVATFDVVAADVANITLDGGGLFLCGACACDGRTHYCYSAGGGPSPMPLAGDAGDVGDAAACADDAGILPRCTPIPSSCPSPSCACVNSSPWVCTCCIDPSGNGLDVSCNFP